MKGTPWFGQRPRAPPIEVDYVIHNLPTNQEVREDQMDKWGAEIQGEQSGLRQHFVDF